VSQPDGQTAKKMREMAAHYQSVGSDSISLKQRPIRKGATCLEHPSETQSPGILTEHPRRKERSLNPGASHLAHPGLRVANTAETVDMSR
jgi:hypothetical protein